MKLTLHIDPAREEEVVVYAHEHHGTVQAIEALLAEREELLIGYNGREAVRLHPQQVCCFTVERERVVAVTPTERLQMRCRLYQLEERLGTDFVRINQSCLVNVHSIQRFGATVGGALTVMLTGGYQDYVSRRQLKTVKERLGLK